MDHQKPAQTRQQMLETWERVARAEDADREQRLTEALETAVDKLDRGIAHSRVPRLTVDEAKALRRLYSKFG